MKYDDSYHIPLNLLAWAICKADGSWKVIVNYLKCRLVMTPTAAGIQNTVFLLEHISINLCNLVKKCFFLHINLQRIPETLCFYLTGITVHYHSLASDVFQLSCSLNKSTEIMIILTVHKTSHWPATLKALYWLDLWTGNSQHFRYLNITYGNQKACS